MKAFLPFAVCLVFLLAAPHAFAATANFFGPIVPDACNCAHPITANGVTVPFSAPGWGCVLQVFQNVLNAAVTLAVVLLTIFIAWAGFIYMTSPANPGARQKANRKILNTTLGLLIVLAAWLLVDSVMKVLYNSASFGPWNAILVDSTPGSDCIAPSPKPAALPGQATTIATAPAGGGGAPPGSTPTTAAPGASHLNVASATNYLDSNAVPFPGNGACLHSIRQALAQGGVNLSCPPKEYADQCDAPLVAAGFSNIGSSDPSPQAGDIVVIQPYGGNQPYPGSVAGHIAMYDGTQWVSDMKQIDFWGGPGYRANQPAHQFYRP